MARGRRVSRGQGAAGILVALVLAAGAWFFQGSPAVTTPGSTSANVQASRPAQERTLTYTAWDEDACPEYYRVVGTAVVDVELAPGEVAYEPLDSLGRAGRAAAVVTYDLMEAGTDRERADMSGLRPSGWGHNAEVDIPMPSGRAYHGKLYNRSHLLAKSLGGEEVLENLVTGTRTQNVGDNRGDDGGMAYTEDLARTWLREHPEGTLYYAATPVYEGDELLCRSVIVDVLSSDGSIDLEVEVYNAARGFEIDYATGEFYEL